MFRPKIIRKYDGSFFLEMISRVDWHIAPIAENFYERYSVSRANHLS